MEYLFILFVVLLSAGGLIYLIVKMFKGQCVCCNDCGKDEKKDGKFCSCKK